MKKKKAPLFQLEKLHREKLQVTLRKFFPKSVDPSKPCCHCNRDFENFLKTLTAVKKKISLPLFRRILGRSGKKKLPTTSRPSKVASKRSALVYAAKASARVSASARARARARKRAA